MADSNLEPPLKKRAKVAEEPRITVEPITGSEEYLAEVDRIRAKRKPFGSFQQKLALEPRPGYHTHWFNDVPGRIDEAKEGGWTHRQDDKGKPVRRVVGTARDKGPLYAYAMDIPTVFWEEDQAAKHSRARAMTDGLKTSPVQTKPGSLTQADSERFYTPRTVTIERK